MAAADRVVTCSDHPDTPLQVAHDPYAPAHVRGIQMQCLQAGHPWQERRRCAWDGQAIGGRRPYRAVFCSIRCRVAAHRWAKRQAAATP